MKCCINPEKSGDAIENPEILSPHGRRQHKGGDRVQNPETPPPKSINLTYMVLLSFNTVLLSVQHINIKKIIRVLHLLCHLRSIAAHRDHFVRRLSVRPSVCLCLSGSHTFLVVTHSYVSQVTHAFLGMLPLCFFLDLVKTRKKVLMQKKKSLTFSEPELIVHCHIFGGLKKIMFTRQSDTNISRVVA